MAGPVSLYAPTPPYLEYATYLGSYTVAQSFAQVGSTLSYCTGLGYAGQPATFGTGLDWPGTPDRTAVGRTGVSADGA